MVDFGTLSFHNARESGVLVAQLGSGTYDHIGFFGANGETSAVEVGSFQDTTILVDENGNPNPALGPFGGSGYFQNVKQYPNISGARISGSPGGPFDVLLTALNAFDPANLTTYPNFANQSSGTLLIRYFASGVSTVNTYNAKIFAFDSAGAITDVPPDVVVFAFEINASGQWYNTAVSGIWKQLLGSNDGLFFSNHSPTNGWVPANEHIWVCGLTVKPTAVGILDQWNLAFQMQFA